MRMLGTCVYMKVPVHLGTQAGLGEHLADGLPHYGFRLACEKLLGSSETLTSGIAGVTYIDLVGELLPGETDFLSVDYDYIIAAVHVRGVVSLVLTAQHDSHFGSKTAHDLVCCIASTTTHFFSIMFGLADTVL